MGISKKEFIEVISNKIHNSMGQLIELTSGDIHRELGGYPGKNHSMPNCCTAMYELMSSEDTVLHSPPKGNGATLTIRYKKR